MESSSIMKAMSNSISETEKNIDTIIKTAEMLEGLKKSFSETIDVLHRKDSLEEGEETFFIIGWSLSTIYGQVNLLRKTFNSVYPDSFDPIVTELDYDSGIWETVSMLLEYIDTTSEDFRNIAKSEFKNFSLSSEDIRDWMDSQ